MRRTRPVSAGSLVVSMVIAYIAILIIGLGFIYYVNVGMHKKRYMEICASYASVYTEVKHVGGVDHVGVGIVYSSDGTVAYTFGKDSFYSMTSAFVQEKGAELFSETVSGNSVFRAVIFVPDKSELGYNSIIFCMIPLYENGQFSCVMCYVFEAPSFLEMSLGYSIIITIFSILLTITVLMHNKNIVKYDNAQKKYVDNVTHELKAPVASVKAIAEVLSDNMERDENEREIYYGMILKETNRQERMIKNILELSKLQSGVVDYLVKKTSPAEVFKEVCEKYQARCNMMDIVFDIGEEINHLPKLRTNAELMKQLLDILLSNAMKFSNHEGGRISLTAEITKWKVTVCITDNGIGIPKNDLPHIFERFYRSSNAGQYTGSGVGLAIASEIITKLKEKIFFSSTLGAGTKVFFSIRTE